MKPHISNLKIEAFRGLKSIELKKLGQFNLLVGFNNSGKSSILEAIEYFCRPMDPMVLLRLSRRRELSVQNLDSIQTLRWLFPANDHPAGTLAIPAKISITGEVGTVTRSVDATSQEQIADSYISYPVNADGSDSDVPLPPSPPPEAFSNKEVLQLTLNYVDSAIGDSDKKPLAFSTAGHTFVERSPFTMRKEPDGPNISCVTVTPVSHRIDTSQLRGLTSATKNYLKSEVVDVLKIFDDKIRGIEILDSRGFSEIWIDHSDLGFVPLAAFGDGLRRVLTIVTSMSLARDGVLLIDEIETAIHIEAFFKFFDWLVAAAKKQNVQVFATTHSIEAVDAVLSTSLNDLDSLVSYQLPDRNDAGIAVKRFSGDILQNIRFEQRVDVR